MSEATLSNISSECGDSKLFPYDRYESRQDELAKAYQEVQPYNNFYFDKFLDEGLALEMAREFIKQHFNK